jgi:hypothetical protein
MLAALWILAAAHAATPESPPSLAIWVARGLAMGLVPGKGMGAAPRCTPGGELAAFRPDGSPGADRKGLAQPPAPVEACTFLLGKPGYSRLFQLTELKLAPGLPSEPVVDWLHARCVDGCDPSEAYGKAITTGWAGEGRVLWLTTYAASEEATHARLLQAAGIVR